MQRHSLYFPDIFNDRLDLLIWAVRNGGGQLVTAQRRDGRSIIVEYDSIGPGTDINVQWAIQPLFEAFYRDHDLDVASIGETWRIDQTEWHVVSVFKTGPIEAPHIAVALNDGLCDVVIHQENGAWHIRGALVWYTLCGAPGARVLMMIEE